MRLGIVVFSADVDGHLDVHDAGLREVEPVQAGICDCQGRHPGVYHQVPDKDADPSYDDGKGDEDADDGRAPDQGVGFLAGPDD